MEITETLTKQITETSYLTTENTKRYRPILRYFYEQYEKINYMLYKEDVWNYLKDKPNFENYTIETCENDLTALVNWGNLSALQDTNNVSTVEECKHRKFRYQLTEYAVEIERLVVKLENLHIEGASLEPKLIERIKEEIKAIEKTSLKDENDVISLWENINNDFKRLNQDYQDYIKTFYNVKLEEVAKSKQFIIYKNDLVRYLREFIKLLQDNSYSIEEILKKGKTPIVVGGTGLYANSLIYGIEYDDIKLDEKYREELMNIAETQEGLEKLYNEAKKIDEKAIEKISPNDKKRIIRILEIYKATGKNKTEQEIESRKKEVKYDYKIFGINI